MLWLMMTKRLMTADGNFQGSDLKISADELSPMERALKQSAAPYDTPDIRAVPASATARPLPQTPQTRMRPPDRMRLGTAADRSYPWSPT